MSLKYAQTELPMHSSRTIGSGETMLRRRRQRRAIRYFEWVTRAGLRDGKCEEWYTPATILAKFDSSRFQQFLVTK